MNDKDLMSMIDGSLVTDVTVQDIRRDAGLILDHVDLAALLLESLDDILDLVDDPRMDDVGADLAVAARRIRQAREALSDVVERLPAPTVRLVR